MFLGLILFAVFVVLLLPAARPDAAPVRYWRGYRVIKQEPQKPVSPRQTAMIHGFRVHRDVVPNVRAMVATAQRDGIQLSGHGYRNTEEQIRLRRVNGCPDIWTAPSSACRIPTAIPGRSQHEAGLAIDFDNCSNRSTPTYRWLARNAHKYGFYNLPSEPWHWSTSGR